MTHSSGRNNVHRVLQMINNCNTLTANSTDYAISHAILQSVGDDQKISLQSIADRASISPAGVSRYIRKIGYDSFEDFKLHFESSLMEIQLNRQLQHTRQYQYGSKGKIADQIFQETNENLQATYKKLDLMKIEKIIQKMRSASSVTILGDDHTLSDFYTFQLDLLFFKIPAYLYKQKDVQVLQTAKLDQNAMVLFLNVYTGFISEQEWQILENIHQEKHAFLVGLFQDQNDRAARLFDEVLLYGIPNTVNDGFYSLSFLSRIFSEILVEDCIHQD